MRTFASPAMLAVRGRVGGRPRTVILLAAAVELITDKTPVARDRIDAPSMGARVTAGAYCGYSIAGPAGVAAGVAGSVVGSYASFHARKLICRRTGLADPVVAIGEDILALTAAAVATRP
jgi:uncharacterized membrane protein